MLVTAPALCLAPLHLRPLESEAHTRTQTGSCRRFVGAGANSAVRSVTVALECMHANAGKQTSRISDLTSEAADAPFSRPEKRKSVRRD